VRRGQTTGKPRGRGLASGLLPWKLPGAGSAVDAQKHADLSKAVLKLTVWGGAGLVASCSGSDRAGLPSKPMPPRGTSVPEAAPLPGRPRNVRVSNDEFVAHAEPSLAANPRDPRNLLGACIAHDKESKPHIAAYVSIDSGASWRNVGALEDSANGRDPTVTFDATGRGYVCANTDDLHVWRTDDGGRTFAAPVLATQGHKLDHPWLAADPAPGPRSATYLYVTWTGPDNTQLELVGPPTAAAASSPRARSTPCAGLTRRTSPRRCWRPGMKARRRS
jgi:hypothetical protein